MCRICDSAASVAQAARGLTDAIVDEAGGIRAMNGTGQLLARAFPVDPAIPKEFRRKLRRIDRR